MRNDTIFSKIQNRQAQVSLEFAFCIIIILLMIYGVMMIFRWTGVDLAERRLAHEDVLYQPIEQNYNLQVPGAGPMKQIDPYFYTAAPMNAIWRGN